MDSIFIKDKEYKRYLQTNYYCSQDGEVYSNFSQTILKKLYRKNNNHPYVDINFGEGQKHIYIHRIVFETWVRPLFPEEQVNHKDDNPENNNVNNLYVGTQKENIQDCFNNNHRMGNVWVLTVYDKEVQKTLTFFPANEFVPYSGHPCKNGGINRMMSRNWYKKRYKTISYYLCKDLNMKGVTTNSDECKNVGQILSLPEALLPRLMEEENV